MKEFYVDTSIFALAAGGTHPDRETCRHFLRAAGDGDIRLHASVETVQEFLFHRLRRVDRSTALSEARAVRATCVLHSFDADILDMSMQLIEVTGLRGRDAVHAATAVSHGDGTIVSLDADFDDVPGLTRLTPAEAAR